MGITVQDVTENDMQRFGWPQGAIVSSVEEGSCAEQAGLKKGDIITRIGDTQITGMNQMVSVKNTYKAGQSANLTVYRMGEEITLTITFDEQENNTQEGGVRNDSQVVPDDPTPRQTASGGYNDPYGGNGNYYDPFSDFPWSYFFP